MSEFKEYAAWDAPTRWFHWLNVLAVVGLIGTGLVVLFDDALGLSASGKLTLKSVHASFGYVMVLNLLWRFAWAFLGNRYARWRAIVPGGPGYLVALRAYTGSFLTGEPQQYVGHNPLARLAVALLFVLLLIQAATGLVLAGTDLYWPPFGHWFAAGVAAPGVDPSLVVPGATDLIDQTSYAAMRAFRSPFVQVHELGFYALALLIVIHIAAVVITEVHEGGSITSAMFTGRKILSRPPPDAPQGVCLYPSDSVCPGVRSADIGSNTGSRSTFGYCTTRLRWSGWPIEHEGGMSAVGPKPTFPTRAQIAR